MVNLSPSHNASDPKCICCKVVVEYNSPGVHWGLCITCMNATLSFLNTRQQQLQKRGLIKK